MNRWSGFEDYRSIDPATFDLLLSAVKRRDLGELVLPDFVSRAFPAFDKVYWRPNRLQFMNPRSEKSRAKSYPTSILLHECVHQLFYRRFKTTCLADQTICLLTEATASVVDIHFVLLAAASQGWTANQFFAHMGITKTRSSERKLIESQFKKVGSEEGAYMIFQFYQKTFFDLYSLLSDLFVSNREKKALNLKKLNFYIGNNPGSWVCGKFDLMNNILFANAYGAVDFSKTKYQKFILKANDEHSTAMFINSLVS